MSRVGEIATEIAVVVMVSIGDGALVLHAEMRRLDEFVTVLVPRERAEPVLEAGYHRLRLLELLGRDVAMVRERPVVHRQLASLAAEAVRDVRVRGRVHADAVVVD